MSQCSLCAADGLTEAQCVRGDCFRDADGNIDFESGCGDCRNLVIEGGLI